MITKQGHYSIAGFECGSCHKEIRVLHKLDGVDGTTVCEECSQGKTLALRMCMHCKNTVRGIGIVNWNDYPIEERCDSFYEESGFFHQEELGEIMCKSTCERWCNACIINLLEQAKRGDVAVFDCITMDEDIKQ